MSQRANATMIGAFVMGALALLVVGLLILGSGRFGGDRETFVLYFRHSTSGLKVGAPVLLKGVQIGIVKHIEVAYDDDSGRFQVPVYIEIDQDQVQWPGEIRGELGNRELFEKALAAGLRARLDLQSMVTGMRQIEVGFFPGTPLILQGRDTRYRELPTIPSAFERLMGQVENLPLGHIIEETLAILEGLKKVVNAEELPRILANLDTAVADLAQTSREVRERVGPTGDRLDATLDDAHAVARTLSDKLEGVLVALEGAAESVRRLGQDTDAEIAPVAQSLRSAASSAQAAFDSAERAFNAVSSTVGERSPLHREALNTLRAVSSASRTVRDLADFLGRHPEALIRGKR